MWQNAVITILFAYIYSIYIFFCNPQTHRRKHTNEGIKYRLQYFIFIHIIQHSMVIHSHKNNTMKKTYKDSIFLVYIQYNIYCFHVFTFKNTSIVCVIYYTTSEMIPSVCTSSEQGTQVLSKILQSVSARL